MRQQPVKIKSIQRINYNVLQIVTEKPRDFNFMPGQATEISINRNGWKAEKLVVNDELILHEVFGEIAYKGEGVFIAGGAGVTPFICIFKYLQSKNKIGNNKLILFTKRPSMIISTVTIATIISGKI